MARPTAINYESVSNTANQMKAFGLEPSVRNVHTVLKHGSLTTISKHLNRWREAQLPVQVVVAPSSLDESITLSINQHIADRVNDITIDLTSTLEEQTFEITTLQNALHAAEINVQTIHDENEMLKQKNAELIGSIETIRCEYQLLKEELKAVRQEREALKTQIAVEIFQHNLLKEKRCADKGDKDILNFNQLKED